MGLMHLPTNCNEVELATVLSNERNVCS